MGKWVDFDQNCACWNTLAVERIYKQESCGDNLQTFLNRYTIVEQHGGGSHMFLRMYCQETKVNGGVCFPGFA